MKKTILLLVVIAMAACTGPMYDQVQISGEVYNSAGEEAEVFYYTDFITNNMESIVVPIAEDGTFDAVLPLQETTYVYLSIAPRTVRMYLKPGASVSLTFDAGDMDAIPDISGDFEKENTFLFAYNQEVGRIYSQSAFRENMEKMSPEELLDYAEEAFQTKKAFLDKWNEKHGLDPAFVQFFQTEIRFEKYAGLLQYGSMYRYIFYRDGDVPELPANFYDFTETAADFHDKYTRSRSYFNFLNMYLNYYSIHVDEVDEEKPRHIRQFELAKKLFPGRILRPAHHQQRNAEHLRCRYLFFQSSRSGALLGYYHPGLEVMEKFLVYRLGKRSLHGNDLPRLQLQIRTCLQRSDGW